MFFVFFSKSIFSKNISGIPSDNQIVWITLRPVLLSGLIWVQSGFKDYQQTALVGKELNMHTRNLK